MNADKEVLLVIFAVTGVLLVWRRPRPDVVAVLVALALGVSGLLTPTEALSGFSAPAVVTLAALFVLAGALERCGAARWLSDRLGRISGTDEVRIALVYMLAGVLLSLIMNNVAAGAVLLPSAVMACRQNGVSPSRILMPLAFGTLLGGMATLFTTANLVVSGTLQAQGQRALGMLDFLPSGGLVMAVGVGVMLWVGRRLLPHTQAPDGSTETGIHLSQVYHLLERLWEVTIPEGSPLIGQMAVTLPLGQDLGVSIVGLLRGGQAQLPVPADARLQARDVLLIAGREERIREIERLGGQPGRPADGRAEARLAVHLVEAVVSPRSPYLGHSLKDLRFRHKYPVTAVALWREGRSFRTDVGDFKLQAGDALLLLGNDEALGLLQEDPGFIITHRPAVAAQRPGRHTVWTVLVALLAIVLSAAGVVSTAEAMLGAAVAVVLLRSVRPEEIYRLIEWPVIVLIGGLLPLGTALVKTGLAADLAQLCTRAVPVGHPLMLIAVLSLVTLILTQFIGGQVTALIVGPMAISAALHLGVNPVAMGVAVSIMCSAAFMTPMAHPVNLLILSAGGYSVRDFVRVGTPMAIVSLASLLLAMHLFWRL